MYPPLLPTNGDAVADGVPAGKLVAVDVVFPDDRALAEPAARALLSLVRNAPDRPLSTPGNTYGHKLYFRKRVYLLYSLCIDQDKGRWATVCC